LFQVSNNQQLTSLPPELGLLANLKMLVRVSKQMDHDLAAVSRFQVDHRPAEIGQLTQREWKFGS
jgi:hypothetical protein